MWIALSIQQASGSDSRVKVLSRVAAKMIDLAIVVFLGAIPILPYPIGPLLGFAYSLFADGIQKQPFMGQSVGKKLLHLRVVRKGTTQPADWHDSALRNAPVGVATFFALIPIWGWLILILIGLPLMIMEIYLMMTVTDGQRLGDVMGNTEVIDVRNVSNSESA
jgi:uncharacterized RDD family membrane protein YckC